LKNSFGLGAIVVALIAIILELLGILNLYAAIAAFLFMFGAWSVVSGVVLVDRKDLYYYVGWGLVLASLSTAYFIPLQYSVAVAIIFIIIIIIIILVSRSRPR
jgi:hypothetical protein